MKPPDTGLHYDAIAQWYQNTIPATYGMAQLERALTWVDGGVALDVGCGSEGRFLTHLQTKGFAVEGLDISPEMIALVRGRCPFASYYTENICDWTFPRRYQFISAWDSTFHLPIEEQEPVLRKLCAGLAPSGVLLFTCGGGEAGEITGSFAGQEFGYSTLGVAAFVSILEQSECFCRHVEYDQPPENHVFLIAQKYPSSGTV